MRRPSTPPAWSLLALPLLAAAGLVDDAPPIDRTPSIRAVMHKQYTVSRAPFKLLKREMAAEAPDWEKLGSAAEAFGGLAARLADRTPPWGEQEDWDRRIARHLVDAEALGAAARGRDLPALRDAHRRIAESCNACHDEHRAPR